MTALVEICKTSDLNEGGIKAFDVGDRLVMLVKSSGSIFALDRMCTHAEADLADGFVNDGCVTCPLHLSSFNLSDGKPVNPPATESLKTYDVVTRNGKIFLRL
ncbi:MAG: non-heme iron oxygenase ferredoxin subunit [Candidatus Aenigmarchaeota archaeon]|nr:non-heme iron oxygenase ferredoxin subunit [Candidatus Aenigmarchaeota archaeon]